MLQTVDLVSSHKQCQIYPAQQEYCVCQLPDISGDICLDYIGTWRQEYFVSGIYNLKKFDFDQKTPGVGTIFFMAVKGLN